MSDELYTFIKDLIEEIEHLQSIVDGEYSTNFDVSDKDREDKIKNLMDTLNEFRIQVITAGKKEDV
jgi:hypothetical protein